MADKLEIIVIRESFIQSLLSDASTFGFLVGGVAINNAWLGGTMFLNIVLGVMLFATLLARLLRKGKDYRKSPDEAIAYIQKIRAEMYGKMEG